MKHHTEMVRWMVRWMRWMDGCGLSWCPCAVLYVLLVLLVLLILLIPIVPISASVSLFLRSSVVTRSSRRIALLLLLTFIFWIPLCNLICGEIIIFTPMWTSQDVHRSEKRFENRKISNTHTTTTTQDTRHKTCDKGKDRRRRTHRHRHMASNQSRRTETETETETSHIT
jgi:uncharacterized membrane protein YciS (DUF1049 family)